MEFIDRLNWIEWMDGLLIDNWKLDFGWLKYDIVDNEEEKVQISSWFYSWWVVECALSQCCPLCQSTIAWWW